MATCRGKHLLVVLALLLINGVLVLTWLPHLIRRFGSGGSVLSPGTPVPPRTVQPEGLQSAPREMPPLAVSVAASRGKASELLHQARPSNFLGTPTAAPAAQEPESPSKDRSMPTPGPSQDLAAEVLEAPKPAWPAPQEPVPTQAALPEAAIDMALPDPIPTDPLEPLAVQSVAGKEDSADPSEPAAVQAAVGEDFRVDLSEQAAVQASVGKEDGADLQSYHIEGPVTSSRWPGWGIQDFSCCGGHLECGGAGCRLQRATLDFDKLAAAVDGTDLWGIVPMYEAGVASVPCGTSRGLVQHHCSLHHLARQYHLEHFTQSVLAVQNVPQVERTAVLIYRDYDNIFHQTASVIASFDYMTQVWGDSFDRAACEIYFLDPAKGHTTNPLWSPGIVKLSPRSVKLLPNGTKLQFKEVLVPMASRAHWFWNVWKPDLTDRHAFFKVYLQRVWRGLGVTEEQLVSTDDGVVTILVRSTGKRRLLNAQEVQQQLESLRPGLDVDIVDFNIDRGQVATWHQQFAQILRTRLLTSTHGAGLVWNLLMPPKAGVLELLGHSQKNEYFSNECRWVGRAYRSWPNRDRKREVRVSDNLFDNNLRADPVEVADLALEVMQL